MPSPDTTDTHTLMHIVFCPPGLKDELDALIRANGLERTYTVQASVFVPNDKVYIVPTEEVKHMESMNPVNIGDTVVFSDQYGRKHNALVTAIHGPFTVEERDEKLHAWYKESQTTAYPWNEEQLSGCLNMPFVFPSLNVVYVAEDGSKTDSYGRQIVRATSVPPKSAQSAHGYYWRNKPTSTPTN